MSETPGPRSYSGLKGVVKKSDGWYARWFVDGKQRTKKFPSKKEAADHYAKVQAGIAPSQRSGTVEAAIQEYIDQHQGNISWREDARFQRLFNAEIGKMGLDQVRVVKLNEIQRKWINSEAELSGRTINARFQFLNRIMTIAQRDGLIMVNPVAQMKSLTEGKRNRWMTQEEEQLLKVFFDPRFWLWVVFAIHTGMRKGEQFSLLWEQIDLHARVIKLSQEKRVKMPWVYLNSVAMAILIGIGVKKSGLVFVSAEGRPVNPSNFHDDYWQPALKKSGIQDLHWHDLRHTLASRMAQDGVPLYTIKDVTGHTSIAMVERYSHLAPSNAREALERFGEKYG